MKKVILSVIGIMIIGSGIFFGKGYLPQITNVQGEIYVESQPETTVFINGETKEKTPFQQKLNPDQYEIKILPDDQSSISSLQQTVAINPGTQTYVRAQLGDSNITSSWEIITLEKIGKDETEITISSETDTSEIYFDGEFKGNVPLSIDKIENGEHEIRLTSPGFAEKKMKVTVIKGYKLTIRTQLALVDESKIEALSTESSDEIADEAQTDEVRIRINSPTTGWLRVRSEPSSESEEVGRVDDGAEFVLLSKDGNWYEIGYKTGATGWISGSYTEIIDKPQSDKESTNNNE